MRRRTSRERWSGYRTANGILLRQSGALQDNGSVSALYVAPATLNHPTRPGIAP
jgi:hypothetical protein